MWWRFGHFWWLWGGVMWLFWVAIVIGVVFFIKWLIQQNRPKEMKPSETPLEVLKMRYARGEINKDEFDQKKKDLGY
jgi:putative membrane protein